MDKLRIPGGAKLAHAYIAASMNANTRAELGRTLAGKTMRDVLMNQTEIIQLDENGCGTFPVGGGSVSVWALDEAYDALTLTL